MVDEQDAVEVVHLVLDAGGQQAAGLEALRSAVPVEIVDRDPVVAFHLGELVEFGETGKIFTTPEDSRTESYITGRIG